jgi:hypothetical protein
MTARIHQRGPQPRWWALRAGRLSFAVQLLGERSLLLVPRSPRGELW